MGGISPAKSLKVEDSPKIPFDKHEDKKNMRYYLKNDSELREMFGEMRDVFHTEGIFPKQRNSHYQKMFDKNIQEINQMNESQGFTHVQAKDFLQHFDKSFEELKKEVPLEEVLETKEESSEPKIKYDEGFGGDFGFDQIEYGTLEPLKNEEYQNIDSNTYFKYAEKQLGIIMKTALNSKFKSLKGANVKM